MFGLQPTELVECAFDIISSGKSTVADAEVILVADEIIRSIEVSVLNFILTFKNFLLYLIIT